MALHVFSVRLDRGPTTDAEFDAMFEAGLDDCGPVTSPNGSGYLMVSRDAPSMIEAILTVLTDITRAGFEATGINTEDMVSIDDIAARTGRSRESVRLLSLGKRGPGGFPSPMSPDGGQAFYSWTMVRRWFADHYGEESVAPADEDAATLAAADLILRARLLTPRVSELRNLIPA